MLTNELIQEMKDYGITPAGHFANCEGKHISTALFAGSCPTGSERVTFDWLSETKLEKCETIAECVYDFHASSANTIDRYIAKKLRISGDVTVNVYLSADVDFDENNGEITIVAESSRINEVVVTRNDKVLRTYEAPCLSVDFDLIGFEVASDEEVEEPEETVVETVTEVVTETVTETVEEVEPEHVWEELDMTWYTRRLTNAGATMAGNHAVPMATTDNGYEPSGETGDVHIDRAFLMLRGKNGVSINSVVPVTHGSIFEEDKLTLTATISSFHDENFARFFVSTLGGNLGTHEFAVTFKVNGAYRKDEEGLIFEADKAYIDKAVTRHKLRAKLITDLGEEGLKALNEFFRVDMLGFTVALVPDGGIDVIDETDKIMRERADAKEEFTNLVKVGEFSDFPSEDGVHTLTHMYLKRTSVKGKAEPVYYCAPVEHTALLDGENVSFTANLYDCRDDHVEAQHVLGERCLCADLGLNAIVSANVTYTDSGVALIPTNVSLCDKDIESNEYSAESYSKMFNFELVGYCAGVTVIEEEVKEFTIEDMVTSTGGYLFSEGQRIEHDDCKTIYPTRLDLVIEANQLTPRVSQHLACTTEYWSDGIVGFKVEIPNHTDLGKGVCRETGVSTGFVLNYFLSYRLAEKDGFTKVVIENISRTKAELLNLSATIKDDQSDKLYDNIDIEVVGFKLDSMDKEERNEDDDFKLDLNEDILTDAVNHIDADLAEELGITLPDETVDVNDEEEDEEDDGGFFGADSDTDEFLAEQRAIIESIKAEASRDADENGTKRATYQEHVEALEAAGVVTVPIPEPIEEEYIIPTLARELLKDEVSPNTPDLPECMYEPDVVIVPSITLDKYKELLPESMRNPRFYQGDGGVDGPHYFFADEDDVTKFYGEILGEEIRQRSMVAQRLQKERRIDEMLEVDETKLDPHVREVLESRVDMDAVKREGQARRQRAAEHVAKVGRLQARAELHNPLTDEEIDAQAEEAKRARELMGLTSDIPSTLNFADEVQENYYEETGRLLNRPEFEFPQKHDRHVNVLMRVPKDARTYTSKEVDDFVEQARKDKDLIDTAPHYLAKAAAERIGLGYMYMLRRDRELDIEEEMARIEEAKTNPMVSDEMIQKDGFMNYQFEPGKLNEPEFVEFDLDPNNPLHAGLIKMRENDVYGKALREAENKLPRASRYCKPAEEQVPAHNPIVNQNVQQAHQQPYAPHMDTQAPQVDNYEQYADSIIAEEARAVNNADNLFAAGIKHGSDDRVANRQYRDNGLRHNNQGYMTTRPNGRVIDSNDDCVEQNLHVNIVEARKASILDTRRAIEAGYDEIRSCPFIDENGMLVTCEDGKALIITYKGLLDSPRLVRPVTYNAFGLPKLSYIAEDNCARPYYYSPIEKFKNGVPLEQIQHGIPDEYIRKPVKEQDSIDFIGKELNARYAPHDVVVYDEPNIGEKVVYCNNQNNPAFVAQNNEQMVNAILTQLGDDGVNVVSGNLGAPINQYVRNSLPGRYIEAYVSAMLEFDTAMNEINEVVSSPEGAFRAMIDLVESNPRHYVESIYHFDNTGFQSPYSHALPHLISVYTGVTYDHAKELLDAKFMQEISSPQQIGWVDNPTLQTQPEPKEVYDPFHTLDDVDFVQPREEYVAPVEVTKEPEFVNNEVTIVANIADEQDLVKEMTGELPSTQLLLGGKDGYTTFALEQEYSAHYILNNVVYMQPVHVRNAPLDSNKINGVVNYNCETHTTVFAYNPTGSLVELLVLKEKAMEYEKHVGVQRIYLDESKGEGDNATLLAKDDMDEVELVVETMNYSTSGDLESYAQVKQAFDDANNDLPDMADKYTVVEAVIKEVELGGAVAHSKELVRLIESRESHNGARMQNAVEIMNEYAPEYGAVFNKWITDEFNRYVSIHTVDSLSMSDYVNDWVELEQYAQDSAVDQALITGFDKYLEANIKLDITDPKPNALADKRALARCVTISRKGKVVDLGVASDTFTQGKVTGDNLRNVYTLLSKLSDKLTDAESGEKLMFITEYGRVFQGGHTTAMNVKTNTMVKNNSVCVAQVANLGDVK